MLIAIGFGVAISSFSGRKASLKRASQQLIQDLQTLAVRAVEDSTIYRVRFDLETKQKYFIEVYQAPMKKPREEDREAFAKWEELQREIEALPLDERRKRSRMDRGSFKIKKQRELPGAVEISKLLSSRALDNEKLDSILFLPSGEVDEALIVLKSEDLKYSLTTQPLTGRVTLTLNELTESDWKKEIGKD